MVKLYSLSTCPWCKKVKQLLGEKNVAYVLLEVDALPEKEQKEALAEVENLTGRRAFPVTVVNEKVIQGYKPEEIDEALQDAGES